MCTNGGKNYEFLIPTKPLAGVRSASYSGKAEIRQNGRYLLGSSEGMADFPVSMFPVDNGIKAQWAPASAPSGVTNNEVLAVTMTGKVVFG